MKRKLLSLISLLALSIGASVTAQNSTLAPNQENVVMQNAERPLLIKNEATAMTNVSTKMLQSPTRENAGKLAVRPKTVKSEQKSTIAAAGQQQTPANRSIILSEGFESGDIPEGWIMTNAGTGDDWQVIDGLYDGYGVQVVWPHSGEYFATNIWAAGGTRNAWLFSSEMELTQGTTYDISFWLSLAGYPSYGEHDYFEVKIGQAATAADMTHELYYNTDAYLPDWTLIETTFTPTASGAYYLGFHAFTPYDEGNDIDIDDIEVSAALAPCPAVTNLANTVDGNSATITWTAATGSPTGYKVYLNDNVTATITALTYTFSDLSNGSYTASVEALYSDDCTPIKENTSFVISITGDCLPVTNLEVNYTSSCKAMLSWTAPARGAKDAQNPDICRQNIVDESLLPPPNPLSLCDPNTPNLTVDETFTNNDNGLSRGNTIYGIRSGYGSPTGHIMFDVDNPLGATQASPLALASILGGEYYGGYYYVSQNVSPNFPLSRVNPTTGESTVITNHTSYFNDMTFDYANNIMYGFRNSGGLYTIDLTTGAATPAVTLTGTPTNGFITVACDLNGNMYGIELNSSAAAGLYSINTSTGVCTLIGSTGFTASYAQGCAFDRTDGTLYWARYGGGGASDFCTVNLTTGAATSIAGTPSGQGLGEIVALYFPYDAGLPTYNVYRDDLLIASDVLLTSYTDTDFNADEGHTWSVATICEDGTESEKVDIVVDACRDPNDPCQDYIVGEGTTGTYLIPSNTFYRHTYSQQIFDGSEIGFPDAEGIISSLSFQYIYGTAQDRHDFSLYLANTSKEAFESTSDWIPYDELQLVYSGVLHLENSGDDFWADIPFDNEFIYTGENVAVVVLDNEGNYYTGSNNTFYMHTTSDYKTLHYRVDGTTPIDPANPPAAYGRITNRNNVKFKVCSIVVPDCGAITNLSAIVRGVDVELSWDAAPDSPTSYTIYNGNTELGTTTNLTYPVTNLSAGTHILGVAAIYEESCTPVKVTVSIEIGDCDAVSNVDVVYNDNCEALITWNEPENSAQSTMLWDQLSIGQSTSGYYAGVWTSYSNYTYAYPADDFDVEEPWTIQQVTYHYGHTAGLAPTSCGVKIFKNTAENKPGEVIYENDNLTTGSTIYDVTTFNLPTPCEITEPGKYWAAFYGNISGAFSAASLPLIILGSETRGLPFRIDGSIFSDINPGDWVEYTGTNPSCVFALAGEVGAHYNVYRDNVLIAEDIYGGSFVDADFDPYVPHTWSVAAICPEGLESAWQSFEKDRCKLSPDATLSSLTVSQGELEPAFNPNVTNYTVVIPWDATEISITGVANHPEATVAGNVIDAPVSEGENLFQLVVTAEDGIATKTYAVTVVVEQSPSIFYINAVAGAGGSISPSGTVAVEPGGSQSFAITPSQYFNIVAVLIDGVNNEAAIETGMYTFENVYANHTISVAFQMYGNPITSTAGENGAIYPAGVTIVPNGQSQFYSFTPNPNYKVSQVLIDGVNNPEAVANGMYTFSNVTSAHTIHVDFELKSYAITASATTGGTIAPSGVTQVTHGGSQTFTFAANANYELVQVLVDGVNNAAAIAAGSYTFDNVTAAHGIQAVFVAKTYEITATAGAGGRISPEGTATVAHGGEKTYRIIPNGGFEISKVLVDGENNAAAVTDGSYTFTNIAANHTIEAEFTAITFTISASVEGSNGDISPKGDIEIAFGETPAFTFTPNGGYKVATVLVDGENKPAAVNSGSYTFAPVVADHSIVVAFEKQTYGITAVATGQGTISPAGEVEVEHGANQTFTFSPEEGYQVGRVIVDHVVVDRADSYTFENVTEKHRIEVVFVVKTGIDDATASSLAVYPNPTSGEVRIRNEEVGIRNIQLFDITGRLIQDVQNVDNTEYALDISGFANGIYFLNIDGKTVKVVKQ